LDFGVHLYSMRRPFPFGVDGRCLEGARVEFMSCGEVIGVLYSSYGNLTCVFQISEGQVFPSIIEFYELTGRVRGNWGVALRWNCK